MNTKALFAVVGFFILISVGIVSAINCTTTEDCPSEMYYCDNGYCLFMGDSAVTSDCNNFYWFDNENKSCSQKEFCGAYMYQGLRTFSTSEECRNALNENTCAEQWGMCGGIAGIACCGELECDITEDYPDASGICVVSTEPLCVNKCGDGTCDEVVCESVGCPCAETKENCPEDCGKSRSLVYSVILFAAAVVLIFIAYKMTKWFLWVLALVAAAVAFYFIFIR